MAPYQPKVYGKWSFDPPSLHSQSKVHADAIAAIKAKQYAQHFSDWTAPEEMNPVAVGVIPVKVLAAPEMTGKMEEDANLVQKGYLLTHGKVSVLPIIKWWYSYAGSITENPKKREAEMKLLRAVGEFAHVCQCANEEIQFLGKIHEYLKQKPTTPGYSTGYVVQSSNNADGIYGPTSPPTPNANPTPQISAAIDDDF